MNRLGATWLVWTSATCLVACGDDGGPTDASHADHDDDGGLGVDATLPSPLSPEAPDLPLLTPCPEGWSELAIGDATACEPWPAGEGRCPDGEARFPGDASCAVLAPCPAGDFADDLPSGTRTWYVLAGTTGGDGSLAMPFARLDEVVAVATAGDVVALGRGTYDGMVTIPSDVSLVGTCPGATTVVAPDGELTDSALRLSPGSSVSGITVSSLRPGIRADDPGDPAIVRDVWVNGRSIGFLATGGATLHAERVVVRTEVSADGRFAYGAFVNAASSMRLDRAVIEEGLNGIAVGDDGSDLVADRVAVRDTMATVAGEPSPAIAVIGATARVTRSVLERTPGAAVVAVGDSTVELDQLAIRDIPAEAADGEAGFGILATRSPSIVMRRTSIERATTTGLAIIEASTLHVEDLIVVDTSLRPLDGTVGGAMHALNGPRVTVERMFVRGSRGADLAFEGPGTTGEVADLTAIGARDTKPFGLSGAAVGVGDGAMATLTRIRVRDVEGLGILINGADTGGTLRDIDIEDVRTTSIGTGGRGIGIQFGPAVDIERIRVVRATEAGILAHGGTVRSTVSLTDVDVRETRTNESTGAAMGIVAIEGGDIVVNRFLVSDNALAGFQIATGGTADARHGVVARNPVGVNFQSAGSGAEGFTEDVHFAENGMNLDSTGLPLPFVPAGP